MSTRATYASHGPSHRPGPGSKETTPARLRSEPPKQATATGPHASIKNLILKTAEGHTTPSIKDVAWNSTGSRVATAGTDRVVRVWYPDRIPDKTVRSRAASGSYSWELKGHRSGIEQVSWDPTHADRVASASLDKSVIVWDYRKLEKLFEVELGAAVLHVSYSPDGSLLAASTKDETICIIDTQSQKVIHSWRETKTAIHQIVWSHAGTLLCLSTQQGTVQIYETAGWKYIHSIEGNTSSVFCLEFDPRGKYLAVGGADAIISLWDLRDWICIRTFTNLTQPIKSLSFTHDGQYLAAGSEDNFIDISDVESGSQVHTIPMQSTVNAIAWHPNKYCLAVVNEDKLLRLYG